MNIQSLLGDNHRLVLSHMARSFIWIEERKERINEFSIGYMINPIMNINKAFKEQETKCMKNTFGAIKQTQIRTILAEKNFIVLALLMLMRQEIILRNFPKC